MQKLITVSREDLDILEASWKPFLPILSNDIAEKTNKTQNARPARYGRNEAPIEAFCFHRKFIVERRRSRKQSPPPSRSKPAPVATPKNDSKPVTEEPPADKHTVPKETVA